MRCALRLQSIRKSKAMTETEAIKVARQIATENGWTWIGVGIGLKRGDVWQVRSHDGIGCLVRVEIEDGSRRVLCQAFMPS